MTLEWVAGAAGMGALCGPVIRAGVLARYDVRPPAATVEAAAAAALAVTAVRAASAWPLAAVGWLMLCAACDQLVRAFCEYHREAGTGPMVNPMPARRGRDGGRADAHHQPLEPFERGRRPDFQPQLPRQEPRYLPTAGEGVPMLQVAPSKTDSERLLLVSPELGEMLAEVINRVRGTAPALPLTARWDGFERQWSPLRITP